MNAVEYSVGDIIEQRINGMTSRFVLIEDKVDPIKNDRPGFHGQEVTAGGVAVPNPVPWSSGVWGYDDEVVRVVRKGTPS